MILTRRTKTLRIERAIEETKKHGIRIKGPKKESHKRTITIDDDLLAMLLAEREKHLRMIAGVPAGAAVDLGLVKLPEGALMFPNPPALAELSFVIPARHGPPARKSSQGTKAGVQEVAAASRPAGHPRDHAARRWRARTRRRCPLRP